MAGVALARDAGPLGLAPSKAPLTPWRSTRASSDSDSAAVSGRWPLPTALLSRPFAAPADAVRGGSPGNRPRGAARRRSSRAPDDAVVRFAGIVVDRPVLTLDHGGGVLSSYEPVASELPVGAGRPRRGARHGRVPGGHCADACLHVGVRVHGEYVSPLLFFDRVPRAVLLPLGAAMSRSERPRQARGMRDPVALFEALGGDVRVDLRGSEAGVAEKFLDRAEVGAAVEQVGRRRVAERVRTRRPAPGRSASSPATSRRPRGCRAEPPRDRGTSAGPERAMTRAAAARPAS